MREKCAKFYLNPGFFTMFHHESRAEPGELRLRLNLRGFEAGVMVGGEGLEPPTTWV